uniref:Uncharacterized protein n=1 Tax=Arundo donax TaxID=35708 RepID=A0A0A8YY95_ARUDO
MAIRLYVHLNEECHMRSGFNDSSILIMDNTI